MSFDPTNVPARGTLSSEDAGALLAKGALVADDRRVRSTYFDGRFLTAKDLTRDQVHFLTRQADLGRAIGGGVVSGLVVDMGTVRGRSDGTIKISRGHGLTLGGEIVVLGKDVTLRVDGIPEMQQIDAALGLARIPNAPTRTRTGLYVLALRPVEYTTNPVASYPTALDGGRSTHDADIVEAVAITLLPYPERIATGTLDERRSRAAHAIFVERARPGTREDALALALVALDHGTLQWVDSFLVRREVAQEQGNILGISGPSRPLREAHLLQYDAHLSDVLEARALMGRGQSFPAIDHFLALPPAGRLPLAAVDVTAGKQWFFPPEVEVSLSVVPDDELGAVLDEAAHLPPIDLRLQGVALEGASVIVLIPVPRAQMDEMIATLGPADLATTPQNQAAWAAAIAQTSGGSLWFVRRKNFTPTGALNFPEM
ncbi:hypothetical protein [Polyangium sp. y55x31]|uniref:hypothetical protein n=1 Tax=Polyangium sp. y55x31 TaxID=3042688 RepID=UPI002482A20C|nr:hypothetical protein [Polyangium sp. y55x31]MDI1476559.1 hypothetical protein [Polyangium sp. y55x31]